jgi:hypothetical protein
MRECNMIELHEMHEPDLKELHANLILILKEELNTYLILKEELNAKINFKRRTRTDPDLKKN